MLLPILDVVALLTLSSFAPQAVVSLTLLFFLIPLVVVFPVLLDLIFP